MKKMKKIFKNVEIIDWCIITLICLLFIIIIILLFSLAMVKEPSTSIMEKNIYYLDAPFGRYGLNIDGTWSILSGTINGFNVEYYTVKYWDTNNTLKSVLINSAETLIIVDGTLKLEIIECHYYNIFGEHLQKLDEVSYKIHIPSLPDNE